MSGYKMMVKDDINFLEYPNWVLSEKGTANVYTIIKPHGKYEIICPLGLPKHFDKKILYFLLCKMNSENKFESCILKTTRYEIAKAIYDRDKFSRDVYARIMQSLRRWKAITITFDGVFYEGGGYSVRIFAVIDEVTLLKETGELTIRFSDVYINQQKDTKYYKLIDFEKYKQFLKASSTRLYEILGKSFKDRKEWKIGVQLLAEKLTIEKREGAEKYYPSDILCCIKSSISEINKKTDMAIKFAYNKEEGVCIFKNAEKPKDTYKPAVVDAKAARTKKGATQKQIRAYKTKFSKLPEMEQEEILAAIKRDPLLMLLNDVDMQINAYMCKNEKYKIA